MKKQVNKWIYWTPRILSMLFIAFLAMFSLDIFDSCSGFNCLLGLLMHNIPVFVLIIVLIISWKYEIVGAIAFILAGLLYIFLILFRNQFEWYMLSYSLIIAGPAFLVGILFLINWKKKNHKS